METAIFTWFGYLINIDERLKLIKNAGFDSVILWWTDEFHSIEGAKEKQPELAHKNGLKVENVHLPFTNINTLWEDSLDGDTYASSLMQLIKF